MLRIGLSGGIGAGKSTVSSAFMALELAFTEARALSLAVRRFSMSATVWARDSYTEARIVGE